MIHINQLQKSYGDTCVLDGIDLHVGVGEIHAIVGHSGAGKSTLLRCINGLETYQGGSLKVFDHEVKDLSPKALRELRKEMGMIFQNFALANQKSVFENVALPLRVHGYERAHITRRVEELLSLVGLAEKATAYPNALSGGQKQRVAIARALALEPKILLSDEATSALDPKTTNDVLELLGTINRTFGITVIIVTHEMEVVKKAAQFAMLLEQGKILGHGRVEELFLRPTQRLKHFLGEEEYLPQSGVNIHLYFPKEVAQHSLITHMARTLDVDFNIVWGKLERLGGTVLGHLVINLETHHQSAVEAYLAQSGVLWEVA